MSLRLTHFLLAAFLLTAGVEARGQISVRSPLSDDREAAPGTSYEGTILVRNDTARPQQAKIYQTDYLFFHDGTNLYGEPGSVPRSNADWIRFSPAVLTLPPGETLPVHYVVTIADSGTAGPLEGTYWSMLMVEGILPGSPESTLPTAPDRPQYGVRQTTRYGVQVATRIAGTGRSEIRFAEAGLLAEAETKALQFGVENTGSILIRPEVWVELYDAAGNPQGRRTGAKARIYPGTSVRQQIDLSDLPPGTYKALVVVDAGGEDVYGAQYTLEL